MGYVRMRAHVEITLRSFICLNSYLCGRMFVIGGSSFCRRKHLQEASDVHPMWNLTGIWTYKQA